MITTLFISDENLKRYIYQELIDAYNDGYKYIALCTYSYGRIKPHLCKYKNKPVVNPIYRDWKDERMTGRLIFHNFINMKECEKILEIFNSPYAIYDIGSILLNEFC